MKPFEFLVAEDDGTWRTTIEQVPDDLEWAGAQKWAQDLLAQRGDMRRAILIAPFNDAPEV